MAISILQALLGQNCIVSDLLLCHHKSKVTVEDLAHLTELVIQSGSPDMLRLMIRHGCLLDKASGYLAALNQYYALSSDESEVAENHLEKADILADAGCRTLLEVNHPFKHFFLL